MTVQTWNEKTWSDRTADDSPDAKRRKAKLRYGYTYVAKGYVELIHDNEWKCKIVVPRGDEFECGLTTIHGVVHRVWWSPALQANLAQALITE
jgi:hypothetical protein